ncbi:MAG: PhoH family protein [Clostridia bacterium]|nr:PhoH family protein [Clostridia bacterium]
MEKIIQVPDSKIMSEVFGNFDENIRMIEKRFNVTVLNREELIKISGSDKNTTLAQQSIEALISIAEKGEQILPQNVNYVMDMAFENNVSAVVTMNSGSVCVTSSGKMIKAKTIGQAEYIKSIDGNIITFGIGPAGTGKTYLAVAAAVNELRKENVKRIILTRPAIEAGEKLGFLPGDLQNKVDPYLRPLYDALYEMLGAETVTAYLEKGIIEIAPLAYMRGKTLDNSFIILDEAQNTTNEQMKMFLTRIGFSSKAVVTGDVTQIDLPREKASGLKQVQRVLKDIEGIKICTLTNKDVVRHPLVQKIINAYETFEKNNKRNNNDKY